MFFLLSFLPLRQVGLETMGGIHRMQNCWSLRDAAMEETPLRCTPSSPLPEFTWLKVIPDATTILPFCHGAMGEKDLKSGGALEEGLGWGKEKEPAGCIGVGEVQQLNPPGGHHSVSSSWWCNSGW